VAQPSALHTLPPTFHASHRRGLNPHQKHTGKEGRKRLCSRRFHLAFG
jgi:hypothetical protein